MKAIAFSNHGGIYDWVKKKQDCDKAQIKYIHGIELYICTRLEADERGFHIGLYAKNYDGVLELNNLYSISTSKGKNEDKSDRHFYYNPRLSLEEIMNTSSNIIITTSCLASILWNISQHYINTKHFLRKAKKVKRIIDRFKNKEQFETKVELLKNYKEDLIKKMKEGKKYYDYLLPYKIQYLKWMLKNNDRCFLEIQYHNCVTQRYYNRLLYKWSEKYNIPLIAGTDTHSSTPYKAECRKILQISKSSYYGEEDEFDLTWKTYDELVNCFKEQNSLPENVCIKAIDNTNHFADMVEEFELDYSFKYPNLYGDNVTKLWKDYIVKKFNEKKEKNIIDVSKEQEYKDKINEEFLIMKKQGMESFMLFMSELTNYCDENNIPYGFGRGSVSGSVIAYITDITDVNPIRWNTVFSRFCNADRISLGDIDIDYAPEDREKVYNYIIKRITPQKTAYIAQFGTLKDRGTIDVLAKGLNYHDLKFVTEIKNKYDDFYHDYSKIIQAEVNLEELDIIEAKSIDFDYHNVYVEKVRKEKEIEKLNELKNKYEELKNSNKDLFYYFDGIKNTIISKGNHPAGIIGSPITVPDHLGVFYKKGDESFPVCVNSMKPVDSLNFTKFDILGLKTVGIMKDAYKYINSHYLKSHEINWEDNKVWDNMITSPVGCFQFEGDFAFDLLQQFQPRCINDASLVNASLRPSGKSYRDRLIVKEFNKNPSKEIDKLLRDNYGFLVYQEDTIKFLTDICGFSGSMADSTRRAIGKKLEKELKEQLPKILEGYCKNSKKPKEIAEQEAKQFLQIISDSSEYQFGYNHSTGYSMNGYASVRLRTYYPLEFTAAYLNRAENEEDIIMGTNLARELGISINPIKFRKSKSEYTPEKETNSIYKGLSSIKFLNTQIADELFELGQNEYNSFYDLLVDIKNNTSVNSRQLNILVKLNFFDEFGKNQKLLNYIELFNKFYNKKQIKKEKVDNHEIFVQYARETAKSFMDFQYENYLKYLWNTIPDEKLSLPEQLQAEKEFLGYCELKIPKMQYQIYCVLEVDLKYTPKLLIYNIQNGIEEKFKIPKKIFKQIPLEEGDIIHITDKKQRHKYKYVDGEYEETEEFEMYIQSYNKPNLQKLENYITKLEE